jgi:hypothetical protein
MSKKLIAVAAAAALALTGLVGTTSASALTVVTTASAGSNLLVDGITKTGSGTNALPYLVAVPEAGTVAAGSLMKFTVSSDVKSRAISVTATSGIKLLDAPGDATNKYTAASGAASWSSTTDAAGAAVFYAFPTTTTKGLVTVTLDGDITQVYVTGVAGAAYDITSVTLPSLEAEGTDVIIATVTDAFGNAVTAGSLTVARVGTGTSSGATYVTYSTTTKRWEGSITAGTSAGSLAVGLTIAGLTATADQKAAFGDPANTSFGVIAVSAKGDIKTVKAELAIVKAAVATLTADYNALANKYNKLVKKSKRVALK